MTESTNQTPAFLAPVDPATPADSDSEYQQWLRDREAAKPKPKESTAVSTGRESVPTEPVKSEVRVQEVEDDTVPQSYVWLPNGEVLLVNDEDLPGAAGVQNAYGHWEKDGKVYDIAFVFPKEYTLPKKEK